MAARTPKQVRIHATSPNQPTSGGAVCAEYPTNQPTSEALPRRHPGYNRLEQRETGAAGGRPGWAGGGA
eukprot:4497015-Prymnesium_polylepis.1